MKIQKSDLMRLVEQAAPGILDWTVGFVKAVIIDDSQSEPEMDAVLAGTGVLVAAGGRHGILTADHVIQNLPKTGPVGLILLGRTGGIDHQFVLEMDFVQKLTLGRGVDESLGPDLGLIVLPAKDVTRLEIWKTFYNLTKRKAKALSIPPEDHAISWVISGLVGEMTEKMTPRDGMKRFSFKGICGPLLVTSARKDTTFDYFAAEVNCGKPFDLPESLGGCSGCGLWQLVLDEHAGKWTLNEALLGGIAFYQSALIDGRRNIEFHGISSIYRNVEEALAQG